MNKILKEKESSAIEFLRAMERPEGYHLAFSGGKDSCIIKYLAEKSGVKYNAVYRVTSVDPPDLVNFIKNQHPDVKREIPHDKDGNPITMWSLIWKQKILPMRISRFCCQYLKEDSGDGKMCITGVRWAESVNRSKNQGLVMMRKPSDELLENENFKQTEKGGVILVNDNAESRRTIESCYKRHKTTINPIIDWSDSEVWQYIRSEKIPYCSLYDNGFHRLGCIGCPMASYSEKMHEFALWPKYKEKYIRMADKITQYRIEHNMTVKYKTGEEYFERWIENPELPGQLSIFDEDAED